MTSHDVVARVRRLAGTRKVGHAGTLDPMATGVLVLGLNRATRLLGHLMLTEKAYDATIRLGVATTTDDAEGEVTATASTARPRPRRRSARRWPEFVGEIEPGAVRGLARSRSTASAPTSGCATASRSSSPRARVTVHELVVTDVRRGTAAGSTSTSRCAARSGTYIRAIARDLGAALGVGGHLTALRRTAVGPFTLATARTLDELGDELRAGADRRGRARAASRASTSTRSRPAT